MTLHQNFVRAGQFLFRFRSFLPLAMFAGLICLFWKSIPVDRGCSAYIWRSIAGGAALAGSVLRCATIGRIPRGTSGRNTKQQKASFLNTTGTYSVVRNPLYLGNALVWIGIVLLFENIPLAALLAMGLLIYYALVVYAEEDYLSEKFGREYASYASCTGVLIPRLRGWLPWDRPFSWRMVLRREHDSIFSAGTGIVFVFQCMNFRSHSEHFMLRREWAIPWLVIACLWLVIKVLKKKTRLLHVPREYASDAPNRESGDSVKSC